MIFIINLFPSYTIKENDQNIRIESSHLREEEGLPDSLCKSLHGNWFLNLWVSSIFSSRLLSSSILFSSHLCEFVRFCQFKWKTIFQYRLPSIHHVNIYRVRKEYDMWNASCIMISFPHHIHIWHLSPSTGKWHIMELLLAWFIVLILPQLQH